MRSILFGFSAVSLAFLPVWHSLFSRRGTVFDSPFLSNHLQLDVTGQLDYMAGLTLMVTLSIFVGGTIALVASRSSILARTIMLGGALALLLFGLNAVRAHYLPWASLSNILVFAREETLLFSAMLLVALALLAGLIFFLNEHLIRAVLIGLPVGAIILLNVIAAVLVLGKTSFVVEKGALATRFAEIPQNRVVWIIFDEADYRLLFENRPDGLVLPNFDKLRRSGLEASQAVPRGRSTIVTIPALIHGRPISSASFQERGLVLTSAETNSAWFWQDKESIFEELRMKGLNAAALGQEFIPYCRIMHRVLNQCWEMGRNWEPGSDFFHTRIDDFLLRLAAYIPVLNRKLRPELFDSGITYEHFLSGTLSAISDRTLALTYIHWNVPHTPYIWDRRSKSYINATEKPSRYFDNAAYADMLLGQVVGHISKSGLADRTALIISSDHSWRRSAKQHDGILDFRVPFIVNFPGQSRPIDFSEPFDTIVTRKLVAEILKGDVNTAEQAARFIRANRVLPKRSAPQMTKK